MRVHCNSDVFEANLYRLLVEYAQKLDATEMFVYSDGRISLYQNNDCICCKEDITLYQLLKDD